MGEKKKKKKRTLYQPPYFSLIFQVRVSLSLLVEEHWLSLVFIEHFWVTASVKSQSDISMMSLCESKNSAWTEKKKLRNQNFSLFKFSLLSMTINS